MAEILADDKDCPRHPKPPASKPFADQQGVLGEGGFSGADFLDRRDNVIQNALPEGVLG